MAGPIIPISDIEMLQETHPEFLMTARVRVFDKEGIPSLIRAYELDRFLSLGFFKEPPVEPPVPVEEPPPYQLPEIKPVIRSFRV